MIWFILGAITGCLYIGLQYVQVLRISPARKMSNLSVLLFFLLRLVLFSTVIYFGLQQGLINALVSFSGFMIARTVLVIIIGSRNGVNVVRSSV